MRKKIKFFKLVASGNDFILVKKNKQDIDLVSLAKKICNRKYGVGADGLLLIEPSKRADIKMRIFNPDGSEANMCGNGARCVAFYAKKYLLDKKNINIETKAGIIEATFNKNKVKIKLTEPKDIKLDIPININKKEWKVNFVNTGVPHVVIFVQDLECIDVNNIGRKIRYHDKFMPEGTNVNFVEVIKNNFIKVRTYERGVEEETLACGTGVVASALISSLLYKNESFLRKIKVLTRGKEILTVYFKYKNNLISDVWLEGKVRIICGGGYYV